ncbi:MAG: glycosyltransferase family 2 protein [Nitrospinae bacterium]|nr:glycosyltransferase family 2 protein [Nitrospinota bacterium]
MKGSGGLTLSLILCGRNDNYAGDFKYRVSTSINYFCRHAAELGVLKKMEVVFVDWNSDVPVAEELRLSPESAETTRFIMVPPNVASKYNSPGRGYHNSLPLNVGLRRARGEFIAFAPADVIFSKPSVRNIFELMEGGVTAPFDPRKAFLCVGRKFVPWQFWERKPGLEEWDRYIKLHSHHLVYENHLFHGICGGYGALLASRELFFETQGVREDVSGWGATDIDLGIRMNLKYPTVPLAGFGIDAYDMQTKPESNAYRHLPEHEIPRGTPGEIKANAEDWGLKGYDFEELKSHFSGDFDYPSEYGMVKSITLDNGSTIALSRGVLIELLTNIYKTNEQNFHKLFLSWYSKHFLPKNYLDYGISSEDVLFTFSAAQVNSMEIYGIDPFKEPRRNFEAQTMVAALLAKINHTGFVHLVSGDPETAFDRLRKAFMGPMSFELVVFRPELFGPSFQKQLIQAAKCLEVNGALLLVSTDPGLYTLACETLEREFAERLLVFGSHNAGVMINIL